MAGQRGVFQTVLAILAACAAALGSQSTKRPAPQAQKPPLSAQEIFKHVSPSVIVVESLDSTGKATTLGSGVVIAPGKVITNRHVIEDGAIFRIEQGGKTCPAKLIRVDPDHDLAELSVAGLDAPIVTVLDSSKLAVGETVYTIGAPEGLELTISEGLISGLREFDNGRVIQTSAAISPGSSGGGLFDTQGRLVGITTFYLKEGQSLNFALPAEWALALDRQPANASPPANKNSPEFQALVWFAIGLKAYEAGKYSAAVAAYRNALRLDQDSTEGWFLLGKARFGLHEPREAIKAYRESIRLKPDEEQAWVSLGLAYGVLKQFGKEVDAEREAIRLKPDDGTAWRNLAVAYDGLGEVSSAISALEVDVKLEPNEPGAWFLLGLVYSEDRQRLKVIEVYGKLKTLDPEIADKFFKMAVLP